MKRQQPLIMYSRPGCHLCERMLAELHNSFGDDLEVTIINVDTDPGLQEAYGLRIPVLVGKDGELCHYYLDEDTVEAYLGQA